MTTLENMLYKKQAGPGPGRCEETMKLLINGEKPQVNCQLYTLLVLKYLGYWVPDDYLSSDFDLDPKSCLISVLPDKITTGDVVGFSSTIDTHPNDVHLGVIVIKDNGIYIAHANFQSGGVSLDLFHEATQYKKHKVIRFIKRPVVQIPEFYNPWYLFLLGID